MMKKLFILGVLTMVFSLASCNRNPSIQKTMPETFEPTTTIIRTTNSKEQIIDLLTAESKELLVQKSSFDELEDRYDLVQPPWAEEGRTYTVRSMPEVIFHFRQKQNGTQILEDIVAPASILLPEYVGVPLDELPFRVHVYRMGHCYMYGDEFIYEVGLAAPDFLAAESIVTIVAR